MTSYLVGASELMTSFWFIIGIVIPSGTGRVEFKYVFLSGLSASSKRTNATEPKWESTPNRTVDLSSENESDELELHDEWERLEKSRVEKKKNTHKESDSAAHLFHIRGTSIVNTRAIEVKAKAKALNSGDAFLLSTPQTL